MYSSPLSFVCCAISGDNALANEISMTLQQIKNSIQNQNQNQNENSDGSATAQLQLLLNNTADDLQMLQNIINELKQGFSVADEKLSLIEFKLSLGRSMDLPNASEVFKEIKFHSDKILQFLFQLN